MRVVVSGVSLMRELYSQLTRYAARRSRRVESCQVAVHAPRFHHRVRKNHHQVLTLQMHGQKAVKQRSRLAHATRIEDAVWLQTAEVGCRKQRIHLASSNQLPPEFRDTCAVGRHHAIRITLVLRVAARHYQKIRLPLLDGELHCRVALDKIGWR